MSNIFETYRLKTKQAEAQIEEEAKKVAFAIARRIVEEQLTEDQKVGDQSTLIKKIAIRVLPKIKDKLMKRGKPFVSGSPISNLGREEHGEVSEVNSMFETFIDRNVGSPMRARGDDPSNTKDPQPSFVTTEKKVVKLNMPNPKGGQNKHIEMNPRDSIIGDREKEKIAHLAARKTGGMNKTQSSSPHATPPINTPHLEEVYTEVYKRGYECWTEESGKTPEQFAFARVHSFINKGKSWNELDADLAEKFTGTPHSEPQTTDPDEPTTRLVGTNSLTDVYKKDTPGQGVNEAFKAVRGYLRRKPDGTYARVAPHLMKRVKKKDDEEEQDDGTQLGPM